uniref:Tubulin polyglutamylase complex subunit 2 n=1 Tax=Astyanax mexicanus TaxID=7994 RepID=A0A8B9KAK2_ASTMX
KMRNGSNKKKDAELSDLTWFLIKVFMHLEHLPGVLDVQFVEREPAEKRSLLSWEQKNCCVLPDDLRDFYLTTDGFTLTWNAKLESRFIVIIQWASLYQPLTFHADRHLDPAGEPFVNVLDPAKAFRGKAKPAAPKKKQPAQTPATGGAAAKGQGSTGRQSVNKR